MPQSRAATTPSVIKILKTSFTLSFFLGVKQVGLLNTALALPRTLALARGGDSSRGEGMSPP